MSKKKLTKDQKRKKQLVRRRIRKEKHENNRTLRLIEKSVSEYLKNKDTEDLNG